MKYGDRKWYGLEVLLGCLLILILPLIRHGGEAQGRTICDATSLYGGELSRPSVMIQLDTSSSMGEGCRYSPDLQEGYPKSPDLSGIIREILDNSSGGVKIIGLFLKGQDEYTRSFLAHDWFDPDPTAELTDCSGDGVVRQRFRPPILNVTYALNGVERSVQFAIENDLSDGQLPAGTTQVVETMDEVLTVGQQTGPVVLRFSGEYLPAAARISSAHIEFTARWGAMQRGASSLWFRGFLPGKDWGRDWQPLLQTASLTEARVEWQPGWWGHMTDRLYEAVVALEDITADTGSGMGVDWGLATFSLAGGHGEDPGNRHDGTDDGITRYRLGIKGNDSAHRSLLREKLHESVAVGATPLLTSLRDAAAYYRGEVEDESYGENHELIACRPNILILVTDGGGNDPPELSGIAMVGDEPYPENQSYMARLENAMVEATRELTRMGISVVIVGYDLPADDQAQLVAMATAAQEGGEMSDSDHVYGLHSREDGRVKPYLVSDGEELLAATLDIVWKVTTGDVRGSVALPTVYGEIDTALVEAKVNTTDWTGDLTVSLLDPDGTPLGVAWSAAEQLQGAELNCFVFDDEIRQVVPCPRGSPEQLVGSCLDLGAIMHSTPAIVGPPPGRYAFDGYIENFAINSEVAGREPLVYVAANDGGLHAFRLRDGHEIFRFFPPAVSDRLAGYTVEQPKDDCLQNSCPEYLLDGSPIGADIFVDGAWKTVLVTGQGRGGNSYFALDVTHGNGFVSDGDTYSDTSAEYLWQFSDASLGLALSPPQVRRIVAGDSPGGSEWALFFGSGPAADSDLQKDQRARIYGLRVSDMARVWQKKDDASRPDNYSVLLDSDVDDDIPSPLLVADVEEDDGRADRIYVGNRYTSLYRIVDIGYGQNPKITQLFAFEPGRVKYRGSPVTTRPSFAYVSDETDDVRVYFGTGRYSEQSDKTNRDQQYLFGLLDRENGPDFYHRYSEELANLAVKIVELPIQRDETGEPEKQQLVTIVCAAGDHGMPGHDCNPERRSWAIALFIPEEKLGGGSERIVSDILVAGGVVIYASYLPSPDICKGDGQTFLTAVDFETGLLPGHAVFDINGDGKFDDDDRFHTDEYGITHRISGFAAAQGKPVGMVISDDRVYLTTTSGEPVAVVPVNLPDFRSRLTGWKQVMDGRD